MSVRTNSTHPWVQPIIVAKTGEHTATIRAAARASVAVADQPHPSPDYPSSNYLEWLDGPFTKTVRRASGAHIAKLTSWADSAGLPYAFVAATQVSAGTLVRSVAVAFTPMRYADLPKLISQCQVAGTDLPGAQSASGPVGAPLVVHVDNTLTTGKAAAQAAHAAWAYKLTHTGADAPLSSTSADALARLRVVCVDAAELRTRADRDGALAVRDAGLTEVASGTLTAVAAPAVRHA